MRDASSNSNHLVNPSAPHATAFGRTLIRCLVFFLLIAVAGLSTRAKNSLYSPRHDSVHYLSIASKMKSNQPPPALEQAPLRIFAGPQFDVLPELRSDVPVIRDPKASPLALLSFPQLRSPPSRLGLTARV